MATDTTRWVALAIIEMTLRGALVLLVCAGIIAIARRSSAAIRHIVWSSGLIAVMALPAATWLVPSFSIPLLPEIGWLSQPAGSTPPAETPRAGVGIDGDETTGLRTASAAPPTVVAAQATRDSARSTGPAASVDVSVFISALWAAGFAWCALRLVRSIAAVRRLVRRAAPVSAPIDATARAIASELGLVRRVVVLRSNQLSVPVTSGWVRPRVVLPLASEHWPMSRLRCVLLHELGHVARMDCLTHWLAQAGCAVHWLNPMAWLAARRARLEREQACDDLVLSRGMRATDYAADLLTIARSIRRRRTFSAALAMASPSDLERRLVYVLSPGCARHGARSTVVASSMMLAAVLVCTTAAVNPWQSHGGALDHAQAASVDAASRFHMNQNERTPDMKRSLITGLTAAALVSATPAQERERAVPQDRGSEARPERVERGGRGERGERGDRGAWMDRMFERVATELKLDEEQRARYDEIVAAQRERMRAGRPPRSRDEGGEPGDAPRGEEGRPERGRFAGGDPMAQFYDELKPILNEEQIGKLDEMRAAMMRGRGGGPGGTSRRIQEELPDELQLDEQQRKQFDELLEQMRTLERDRFESSRPLFEQMREARDAGDEERLQAIREELEKSRGDRERPLNEFFDALDEILRDDQKQRLAGYREELSSRDRRDGATDVRGILRAAKRLELTEEQKDALRDIEREASEQARDARGDRDATAKLTAEVKEKISKLLDDEQRSQFENSLRRDNRRGRPQREPR